MLLLCILACAAQPVGFHPAALCGDPYGFWSGLWHGLIAPFSFLGSLFESSIAVYAPCNNGGWYSFGFCLGIGAFAKGSSAAPNR